MVSSISAAVMKPPQSTAPSTCHPGKHWRGWRWSPVVAGAAFVVLAAHAASVETVTIDEFAHVPAGCAYLSQGRLDLYSKNPPLLRYLLAMPVLQAAAVPKVETRSHGWEPWEYGDKFMAANFQKYPQLMFRARLVVVFLGLLTGIVLFLWTRSIFGPFAASIATSMYYLSPTVLAHGHLATVDVGSMLAILATIIALRWALRARSWARLTLVAATWAAALLTKFTAILLAPFLLLILVPIGRIRWWQSIRDFCFVVLLAVAIINLGMLFRGSFRTMGSFDFSSSFMQSVQRIVPARMPIPLPQDYVLGFDAQKRDTESGEFGSYLLGRWSQRSAWYDALVTIATKMPLPLLLLLGVSPWSLGRLRLPRGDLWAVLVPLIVLLLLLVFFNRLSTGIRYLLPVFPLLFCISAAVWRHLPARAGNWLAGGVLVYYAIVICLLHPAYLSFFNAAVGGPKQGYRILADSNLDWGQDLYRLKPALRELEHRGPIYLLYFGHVHPALYDIEYQLLPPKPVEGMVAVSVNFLVGMSYIAMEHDGQIVEIERGHASWLADLKPVMRAGSIWIYDTRIGR